MIIEVMAVLSWIILTARKELIRPFMPVKYTACEIFGRHLVEDWFTWGDEAVKFNESVHWTEA